MDISTMIKDLQRIRDEIESQLEYYEANDASKAVEIVEATMQCLDDAIDNLGELK